MTHQELVHRATKWLRSRKCNVVLAEPTAVSGLEIPDAIGWSPTGAQTTTSVLVECKVSRADFLKDRQKGTRTAPNDKQLGNERWFMTPRRLLEPGEIPEGWGLVEVTEQKAFVVKPATRHRVKHEHAEQVLLITALGRVQEHRFAEAFLCPEAHTLAKHWAQIILRDAEGLEVGTVDEEVPHDPWDDHTEIYRRAVLFEAIRSRVNGLAHDVFGHRRKIMNGLSLEVMPRLVGNLKVVAAEVSKALKSK